MKTLSIYDLNVFYSRFDKHDLCDRCDSACEGTRAMPVTLRKRDVISVLQPVNLRKPPGPGDLKGRVLKECATQLGPIFTQLFQLFLNASFVP